MVLVPLISWMPCVRRPNSFANDVTHTSLYVSCLIKCQYFDGGPIVSSMIALHTLWVWAIECGLDRHWCMMALVKWRCRGGSLDDMMLLAIRWALDHILYWLCYGGVSSNSLSSWVMICGWWRLGCWGTSGGIKVTGCGAAMFADGRMVWGTSVALAGDFVCVSAVSNS